MFTQSKISVDEYLAEHIVEQRRRNPQDRNGKGWQSQAYRDQPFAWFDSVYKVVEAEAGEIDSWWFNVNTPGEYTGWHAHHRWPRVAVLYVSVPAGVIEFRQGGAYWTETPEQGDLLIFPGKLDHRVRPNTSTEQRISVAFNFK
jgi:hypothetical protein